MALMASGSAMAQSTPTHPLDFNDLDYSNETFATWFPAWVVGNPPTDVSRLDDEFFISRTRPVAHISEENDVVDPNLNAPYDRKFCGFYGATDPTDTWKTLPRYCFEGDSYSMWNYTDMFSNWTAPFFRCTAGLSDVAAKNGASVGVNWAIPWAQRMSWDTKYLTDAYSQKMGKMCEKDENGNFKYAEKLVKLMRYYGISALSFNSEFHSNSASMEILADFFKECHKIADRLGWKFEVHWYGHTGDSGVTGSNINEISGFTNIFGDSENRGLDMLFINYGWTSYTLSSIPRGTTPLNRSSYDVFAGFDIQGSGLRAAWQALHDSQVSLSFWGAHKQNLIHESSNDYGTSDLAIQKAYLTKQNLITSGGNGNPAVRPAIKSDCSLSISSLEGSSGFHGLANLMRAKSSIQNIPFVSRFNLGNGQKFYNRGDIAFDSKWYNIGTQDYLPTWRFWITNDTDNATQADLSRFIKAELIWDEAWFGGSCLSLTGATEFSRVKLFKTFLPAKSNEEFSIVYKPVGSDDSHLKLFLSLKDVPTAYKEIAVPAGKADQWNTFTAKLSDFGVSEGDIVLMGVVVENTPSTYKTLIGEMALRDPQKTYTPAKAEVKEVQILRGRFNQVDFKMRYAAKEESGEMKTFNDEVDTWYYEIFIQQENQEPQLLTATPSWAAYVIGAPIKSGHEGRRARFGVRAVSPNGDIYNNNTGEISWSEYMDIPYNETVTDLEISKAVIKPNEAFTVKYVDDMAPAAKKWEILSAVTGNVVATQVNSLSVTTSIPTIGVYDLRVTDSEGNQNMMRAKIQVTTEATGAVPTIFSITADKSTVDAEEEVKLTYTSRNGEGRVSRAVKVTDPQMLQIPGEIQSGKTYSYALWFKADAFAHLSNGTNLISKNTTAVSWPHNNWGDLWVQIRPEGQGYSNQQGDDVGRGGKCGKNEISFNTMGWTAHQQAYGPLLTKGYSVEPGSWNHVVVTHDDSNNQCIYLNGKLVASGNASWSYRRFDGGSTVANIHIGGSGVYKAAFNGAVDEVQVWTKTLSAAEVIEAMNGYAPDKVPADLAGYYTFETMNADGTFPNLGKAGADKTAKIVIAAGSGGENTSGASYVQQDADNSQLGNPGIEGSLDIITKAEWNLTNGEVMSESDKTATVVYYAPGKYDVQLTLTNGWGTHTYTEPELVEVTGTGAIGDTWAEGEFEVTANHGIVSFRFAEAGLYTVNIIGLNGQTLQSGTFHGEASGTATVAINAPGGVYLVQVLLNGQPLKTVKVVK